MFEEVAIYHADHPAMTRGLLALLHLECDESLFFPWDVMSTVIRRVIEALEVFENFDDMTPPLDASVLRGIYAYGFEKPSLVQQNVIIPLIKGRDCLIQAQSGTGKTACYCISILQRVDFSSRDLQALVLCPTWELSFGVESLMKSVGEFRAGGPFSLCAVGGSNSIRETIEKLNNDRVLVIVGTPGRACYLENRKCISLKQLRVLVLDEVDESLGRGGNEHIAELLVKLLKSI